ncbi:MAG: hypothetical protein EZS28_016231 [Streblomastix strix]|uniref:Right handed beta helix domain-containing protein n=1 Tax=Streblomastix strix TaxID=222440 RepID=A0A5J4W1C8_9EUKA|nr:MAG: hypothetical protein EZS28_016231 [Streblomastix strix]
MDQTTLSSPFTISSALLPRRFTNNPSNSITQSEIEICNGSQFRISGNIIFEYIKFTIQAGDLNLNGGAIYASFVSSNRTLEITSCSFIGCKSSNYGGAIFIEFISVGKTLLNNVSFDQCQSSDGGGIYFSNANQGEMIFRSLKSDHCESYNSGGALFAHLESGGKLTISGSCLFTDCNTTTDYYGIGGGIYASIIGENSQLIFEDSITFERCSGYYGGGIFSEIRGLGKLLVTGTFSVINCSCTAQGGGILFAIFDRSQLIMNGSCSLIDCKSDDSGGGLFIALPDPNYDIQLIGQMHFEGCTSKNGGGMYFLTEYVGQITINDISFTGCNSTSYGGGLYTNMSQGAQLTIIGKLTYTNCYSSAEYVSVIGDTYMIGGGGFYLCAFGAGTTVRITGEMEYKQCSSFGVGGGLNAYLKDSAMLEINRASFTDCLSINDGGGLYLQIMTGSQFAITGTASLVNCFSSNGGGGIGFNNEGGTVIFNPNEQILIENCNSEIIGGGIYCQFVSQGQVQINNMKFSNCKSQGAGGGIFALNANGGQLTLDNMCEFYQCQSGIGGGIYIFINSTTQSSFIIKDAFFHECKAVTNTSQSYSYSGNGGGLILAVYGDHGPSTEMIDLRGMKIYNNSADRFGYSLFVAMAKIEEFCKQGFLGEYIKGNYSDTYSDEQELVGIPVGYFGFDPISYTQIQLLQKPLEPWWRILGILKSSQVIVNVSNPNGKLIFHIEGKRMIPGYLNVKIFEFGNKLQENIDQEKKEITYQYNKNNLKSLKGTSIQSPNTLKHQTENHQQISINPNLTIKKKIHNYEKEIIYPPEDGSSFPIQVDGEIESEQTATFGMNDYKWLNYREKVYAVLISNDRNIFTGKDGIDIEEDANVVVKLEFKIEDEEEDEKQEEEEIDDDDDEQNRKEFPIIYIIVIAVMGLIIIIMIIIIIIVVIFASKKQSQVRSPPLIQQQSQVRSPPLNSDQSVSSNDIINDNGLQHHKYSKKPQSNNPTVRDSEVTVNNETDLNFDRE